ncbi:MAG: HAD family hydrolase [Atopobiaceae bacterium]|jgi:Cof subfamily protein (haloacid dehalogenase superfamily)|nr:HAD family hydrolase [Atopobiaceae bacterium]MCI2172691.1 HAD family hydrolase [Atopobiaceae bacterium]MCI2206998.1 HAD family hydrolase [Atopobiaceae bacterium]
MESIGPISCDADRRAALLECLSKVETVALDLDGTLFDDEKEVSAENRRAIRRTVSAGVLVVPATGRVRAVLPESVTGIDGIDYVVGANGSSVMKVGDDGVALLRERGLDPRGAADLVSDLLRRFDIYVDVTCAGTIYAPVGMTARAAEFDMSPFQAGFVMRTRVETPDFLRFVASLPGPVERVNLYAHDEGEWGRVHDWLCHRGGLELSNSLDTNIEINEVGVSKWDGISWLAAHTGRDASHVLAMGDGTNDVAMLTSASCGIAMANAPEVVRASADGVAPANTSDGVAAVLDLVCDLRSSRRMPA